MFFKDIDKYKILSGEEQVELAKKAKAGDERARNKLITSNLRFVVTCAKKYTNQGVPLVDLIQAGIIGMCLALDNYDPDKGYKFLSFAVWYIRRELLKEIYNHGKTIRYPITYISKITKVKKVCEDFIKKNNREPTDEELLDLADLTEKQLKSVIMDKSYCQSIDTPLMDDKSLTLEDIIPDEESDLPTLLARDAINSALSILNDREYKVITEFYGLNGMPEKSIKDIALEMHLGDERIRQIRKAAIKKLQQKKSNTLKILL